jgi:hypothetical protein
MFKFYTLAEATKIRSWVARSKTQLTHQHPGNVGFRGSTQPTLEDLSEGMLDLVYSWIFCP